MLRIYTMITALFLVLTAAHCLYDVRTDAPHGPRDVTFRAGWRNGFAHAVRSARAIYVHPNFSISHGSAQHRLTNDLALIQLDSPIRDGRIQPFDTDLRPAKGASVAVVSYAHDRADAPSMQSQCGVLARQGGVIVTSCDVDFGSSGAPIFSVENGEVSVVSVVSAKVQFRGQRASVGTALGANLGQILDLAEKGSSHFQQVSDASALFPEITNIEFVRAVSAALEE